MTMDSGPRALLRHPWGWVATGLGSGLAPFAPGTFGTLAAMPLGWALLHSDPWLHVAALLGVIVLGSLAAGWVNRRLALQDPGCIVIDEWAGLWLTLLPLWWLPPQGPLWPWWLLAFGLFRLTDISKPWPASWADRHVKGGWGVMLDDLLAALWSALALAGLLLGWSALT